MLPVYTVDEERLHEYVGQKILVVGVIDRRSKDHGSRRKERGTKYNVLIKNIRLMSPDGPFLTDHTWIRSMELHGALSNRPRGTAIKGIRVSFRARVVEYTKADGTTAYGFDHDRIKDIRTEVSLVKRMIKR